MYEYNCKIVRVVDGDTVDVDVDLGWSIWRCGERIRLYGIDTPECRARDAEEKAAGLLAKEFVEDELTRNPDIAAMVGLFEYNPPIILDVLRERGDLGKVKIVGFDENPNTLQAIKDGEIHGTIVQDPYEYGNRSIFAGSYGWTNSGRFHHASSLLRRTMNLVGGYTGHVDTYSVAAGPVILRHVLGSTDACQGRANSLHNIAANTETMASTHAEKLRKGTPPRNSIVSVVANSTTVAP